MNRTARLVLSLAASPIVAAALGVLPWGIATRLGFDVGWLFYACASSVAWTFLLAEAVTTFYSRGSSSLQAPPVRQ